MRDVIKYGQSKRYLSKGKVNSQCYEKAGCTISEKTFTCLQNLVELKELEHGLNALFKCNMCPKMF